MLIGFWKHYKETKCSAEHIHMDIEREGRKNKILYSKYMFQINDVELLCVMIYLSTPLRQYEKYLIL